MKATITLEELTAGNLTVGFKFEPELTPENCEGVVGKALAAIMAALRAGSTVAADTLAVEPSRIITP